MIGASQNPGEIAQMENLQILDFGLDSGPQVRNPRTGGPGSGAEPRTGAEPRKIYLPQMSFSAKKTCPTDVSITEARGRGGVGYPRGLIVNVVLGQRGARVSPDPGPTPGRPATE